MAPDIDADAVVPGDGSDPLGAVSKHGMEPLACVSCRSRKLKCDRTKPACSRCVKVNNECVYPESRRKPTFKRRNVKELEARLAQVEDYLKEVTKNAEDENENAESSVTSKDTESQNVDYDFATEQPAQRRPPQGQAEVPFEIPDFTTGLDGDNIFGDAQLMDLGITETLPPFEVMEELTTLYFTNQHPHVPIVHPGRYWQAFYGGPSRRPPMCLQYAIWAVAAQFHSKYDHYSEVFYKRARQYADADEMKGSGEYFITVPHAQAYAIIASYEAKCMYFTRAALTSAKCVRLVEMMGLDRLDGEQDDIPPSLGPATSWVEIEERRRTFWGAFVIDSHASISTGWPSLINSADVVTRLPAPEDAFLSGTEEQGPFPEEIFKGAEYSGFAGTIVTCRIFKTIMHHVHRPNPHDNPEDLMHGPFWARHRNLDNELSNAFMFLPAKLTLPQNMRDPIALHTNLNLHASVICLHHAAIEKAEKYNHTDAVKRSSLTRLKASAEEIVNIVRLTCHSTAVFKSPLSALSLYCASTVYIYVARDDSQDCLTSIDIANLELLISSMEAIGRVHQITKAFLQQACLDVERNGLETVIHLPSLKKYRDIFNSPCSNVPVIARNAVGRHSEISPVLPGRLPLDKPKGRLPPANLRLTKSHFSPPDQELQCFQPMLGAVTRNISGSNARNDRNDTSESHKRKRMSSSPVPSRRVDLGLMGMSTRDSGEIHMSVDHQGPGLAPEIPNASNGKPRNKQHSNVTLPDRTNSSASSSPLNRASGYADTQSGSSHTSPGVFGLGNTAEENRVDLRPFQDRVATPIWQTMADEVFFGQITDTMVNNALATGGDPWGILNGELDWGIDPSAE